MNKNMKGAVAIGAATLLLLGGGGSLALWNATETVDGGTVSSGELNLDVTDGTGRWYLYVTGQAIADYDPLDAINTSTYLVVPQDELIFIRDGVDVNAQGGELYFTFAANAGTADATGFTIEDVEVTEITGSLGTPIDSGLPSTFLTVPDNSPVYGGTNVNISATLTPLSFVVTFDADDTDFQLEDIDFSDAEVIVKQVVKS